MIQLDLFAAPPPAPRKREAAPELHVAPWESLPAWIEEIERLTRLMRLSTPHHQRFHRTARQLTAARIRCATNRAAIDKAGEWLDAIKRHSSIGRLDRAWTRAELGTLIVEIRNRQRLLDLGRLAPKVRGPRFDVTRIPDAQLDALIQRHRDMEIVEACRAERLRRMRAEAEPQPEAPPAPPPRHPVAVASIRDMLRERAAEQITNDRRRWAYLDGAGAMLTFGIAKGSEQHAKKYHRDFFAGAGDALSELWKLDHAAELQREKSSPASTSS